MLNAVTALFFVLVLIGAFQPKAGAEERRLPLLRPDEVVMNLPKDYTSKNIAENAIFYFPAASKESRKEGIMVGVNYHEVYRVKTKQEYHDYACTAFPGAFKCGVTEIDGKMFAVISSSPAERLEKAFWHFSDGYAIYIGINSGNKGNFVKLETIVESAQIPPIDSH